MKVSAGGLRWYRHEVNFKSANRMARNVFVVVLLLGAFGHCVAEEPETGQKPQYTRTRELPALKISFADMQSILEKAANLLSAANVNPPKEKKFYFRETLTLGKEPDEMKLPATAFRLQITFTNSGPERSPRSRSYLRCAAIRFCCGTCNSAAASRSRCNHSAPARRR